MDLGDKRKDLQKWTINFQFQFMFMNLFKNRLQETSHLSSRKHVFGTLHPTQLEHFNSTSHEKLIIKGACYFEWIIY